MSAQANHDLHSFHIGQLPSVRAAMSDDRTAITAIPRVLERHPDCGVAERRLPESPAYDPPVKPSMSGPIARSSVPTLGFFSLVCLIIANMIGAVSSRRPALRSATWDLPTASWRPGSLAVSSRYAVP